MYDNFNTPDNMMAAILGGMMGAAAAAAEDANRNPVNGASSKEGPGMKNGKPPVQNRDDLLKKAAQNVAKSAKILNDAFTAAGFPAESAITLTAAVLGSMKKF